MTRAYDDATSTCGTCLYFSPDAPDGGEPDGHCNWLSLPAYVYKNRAEFNTLMLASDGKNCWLHTKRETPLKLNPLKLLKRVASHPEGRCRVCGGDHNCAPCPSLPQGEKHD